MQAVKSWTEDWLARGQWALPGETTGDTIDRHPVDAVAAISQVALGDYIQKVKFPGMFSRGDGFVGLWEVWQDPATDLLQAEGKGPATQGRLL